MKKLSMAVLAATAALGLALSGCAGGGAAPGAGVGDDLTIALASAPVSLDPSKAATGLYINYVEPTYASLLNRAVDGTIVEGLADEWGYVGDGNTDFEFSLREGAKWADGSEITADDVIASFEYFRTGSGPSANYLGGFTFTAVDDATVHITSATPNPVIAELLTPEFLAGAIISPEGLADPAALGENTFGAGPYVLDTAQTTNGDTYVFTPNENYYDQDAIEFESISVRVIPNTNSAVQALRSGQVDFIAGTADAAAAVENDSNIETLTAPFVWAGLFLLDRTGEVVPALADVRVRQALNYAVDRDAIAKAVYGEFGAPVDQPAVPGFDGYSEASEGTYEYDPDRAREMLEEAGYGGGITIPVNYGAFDQENTKLVQAVQSQLAEVGVTLELKSATNFGGWVEDLVSKTNAATVLSPGSGGSAYYSVSSAFMPGGIMNIFGAEDAEMTAAFGQLSVASPDDRAAAAQATTDAAVKNALALPIAYANTIVLYNKSLKGVEFTRGSGLPTFVTDWTTN
jgi:peptide/nickel transport system substrate-binding protein